MEREIDLKEISDGRLYSSSDMVKADCGDCKGCSACCQGMGSSILLDPYDIYRLSTGTGLTFEDLLKDRIELNKLLCEGAPPATSAEDILFGIGWQKKRTENKAQTEEKPVLSPEETVIYDLLEQGSLPYDALCQMTKMAQGALSSCLTLMEIRGIIRQLPGRIYELIYKE